MGVGLRRFRLRRVSLQVIFDLRPGRCGASVRQMVEAPEVQVPPKGGYLARQTEPSPSASPPHDPGSCPRANAVVKPHDRVRSYSFHRGRFLMRDDPCALCRVPIPRAYFLHGLARPHPVAVGLHHGLFHWGAGKEKPRDGCGVPRLKYPRTEPKEGSGMD